MKDVSKFSQLYSLFNYSSKSNKVENLIETLENYKIQMGKYHKIILNDGKVLDNELITESVLHEHKTKLYKNLSENNLEGITEVLLSLRVNAL